MSLGGIPTDLNVIIYTIPRAEFVCSISFAIFPLARYDIDSRFTQQELPACKPILTPQWVISVFTLVGIIFIPIGVVALLASNDVVEIVDRYEIVCVPSNMTNDKIGYIQNPSISKTCTRKLKVPKDMDKPIYVYYQLDNFYQNHRRYVKSRNDQQLRDASKANKTSGCDPEKNHCRWNAYCPLWSYSMDCV